MIRKTIFFLWIILIVIVSFPFLSEAKEEENTHVVLVLVPGLSSEGFFELMEQEDDKLWINASAIMLNRVTEGRISPLSETLTLSSGMPATSSNKMFHPLEVQFPINTFENQYTLPAFKQYKNENKQTTHQAEIGMLGEILQTNNVHSSFIGHSDFYQETFSFAPFFTVDKLGETAGNREAGVKKEEEAPGGYVMDVEQIVEQIKKVQQQYASTWTVVEWGDIYRQNHPSSPSSKKEKEVFGELRQFITELRTSDHPIFLLGMAPPSKSIEQGLKMVPFVKWDQHLPVSSAFYSPTVKQQYLGSSLDVAPSFLKTFGLEAPRKWNGNYLISEEKQGIAHEMKKETAGAAHIHVTRASVLSTYITLLVILLVAGFLYWKGNKQNSTAATFVLKSAVLAGMISPISFTLAPLIFGRGVVSVPLYFAAVSFFSIGSGALAARWGKQRTVWIVSLAMLAVLSLDLFLGAPLIQRSYLGYDPLIGARYGGIGNELGGFFTAAAILFLEPFWKERSKIIWVWILVFLIILGASIFGKNAGVMLASGLMFFTLVLKTTTSTKFHPKRLILNGVCVFLGLLGLLWVFQQFGEMSHIGGAFQLMLQGEWGEILSIISRKMQMNVKIIMHSNWTKLLLTSYVIAALYLLFESAQTLQPSQQDVLRAGAMGSVFLLLLNDSGAVAASTSMFFLLCARYVWSFDKSQHK
ncbi:hypothetical protein [Alteribacillus bidgolensis]|uniref:Uncharacterized protein n=1 Tax=Alteribacillus bidgolensis TaxID=930129 RepID=A0A1G8K145_9BACI|nr:hypothetical protein [Alteribacillus bidgolensis]SDI37077.1 hypothetical protein SAMN05216352_10717 [Alteribacillus bidgolensis]